MWRWDQGHLEYFQFDAIRKIAGFVTQNDFVSANRDQLLAATGLGFTGPSTHTPWRQYSRALRLCMLMSDRQGHPEPTPVAHILSTPGAVTCDEYMHFLAQAFSSPSPAFTDWVPGTQSRYPLLFALKYLLTKARILPTESFATFDEIVAGYDATGFRGDEDDTAFIGAVMGRNTFPAVVAERQPKESLQVIAQISYLYIRQNTVSVSLNGKDAEDIFHDLHPVLGPQELDRDAEIRRLSALFADGSTSDVFSYPNTVTEEVVESGFREGNKIKKTHVTIERNSTLRRAFFASNPIAVCDVCQIDTAASFPWTDRVMDLHHLLPLSSGTRVESSGTTFDDLVALCPTCHRAVHRFYDQWLKANQRDDFQDGKEALQVYQALKSQFPGLIHA